PLVRRQVAVGPLPEDVAEARLPVRPPRRRDLEARLAAPADLVEVERREAPRLLEVLPAAAAAGDEGELLRRVADDGRARLLVEGVELLAGKEVAVVVEEVLARVLERVLELDIEDRGERVVVVEERRARLLVRPVLPLVDVAL